MDSAFIWLREIAEWLGRFVPKWIILDTTEGAIKYVKGKRIVMCGPGVHWHWPITTTWQAYPTAQQTDRLETQTMVTTDGKTFIVAGTITYWVTDLSLLLPVVHMATRNTVDLSMVALHDVCCEMSWEELQSENRRGTLKTKLKNAAQKQLEEYGVKVKRFQLNTLAPCRVLKISQSTSNEEN